jgi:hypothetical protein
MTEHTEIPVQENDTALAQWVWNNLIPKQGQSAWVQGELLRCVEKLCWEAQNNGNGNWGRSFRMLADYLEKTLCAEPAFSEQTRQLIRKDMATVKNYMYPYTEDDLYDRLVSHVVAFCRLHPVLIPKPHNPKQIR